MNSTSLALDSPAVQQQSSRLRQLPRSASFVEFNGSEIEQSISARFEKQVEHYPDRIALKTREGTLTYEQLNQRANRLAHALLQRRELREEPVAFFLSHGIPQIVAILGILKAGKIYVPLDPAFPLARLTSTLADCGASLIVTDAQNRALAQELAQNTCATLTLDDLNPQLPPTNPDLSISADTTVNIIYTSGATGRPKGVIHTQRVILHNIMSATNTYGISRDERIVLLLSVGFSASFPPLFSALLNGATLLPYNLKADGFVQLANWLRQERITIYDAVPSTFRRFVTVLPETAQFPHLRLITLGGEPVYKRDVELFKKHFSDDCLLCVRLAGTETRIVCSWFIDKATPLETNVMLVGYADAEKKILLLDDAGKEVAVNQIGEIAVKSRYLATGYWRNPQLTQTAFRLNPQGGEERIYHTGDLGRIRPDGCLEHLGRKDSQVKIRGHRVEIGEVEMALLDLDNVKEAAVGVKEDSLGRKYLVAYLVPGSATLPPSDILRAALGQTLPTYMIPSHFMTLESLPLTATGKIDYRTLPDPPRTRPDLQTAFLAPRTEVETKLQQIWQQILDIQPIGVQDNFFDLGGDSLTAVEVLTRIEQAFHVILLPGIFIQEVTIESLAHTLGQHDPTTVNSQLIAIQPFGSKPPFFCTGGYGRNVLQFRHLRSCFHPDQPVYGLRHPRLGHKQIAFAPIEHIAPQYVATLLAHQAQGPYYLGGYSFGCFVAFEMAQLLHRAGHQVGALIFLDLRRYGNPRQHIPLGSKIMARIKQEGLAKAWKRVLIKTSLLRRRFTSRLVPSLSVAESNILAKSLYVPKPYPGRVIFFQTQENQDVPYTWEPLIAGGIEVHAIPGDHDTMWHEPQVQILAEKLKTRLAQIH